MTKILLLYEQYSMGHEEIYEIRSLPKHQNLETLEHDIDSDEIRAVGDWLDEHEPNWDWAWDESDKNMCKQYLVFESPETAILFRMKFL